MKLADVKVDFQSLFLSLSGSRQKAAILTTLALMVFQLNTAMASDNDAITTTPPSLTVTSALPKEILWPHSISAYGAIAPWQEANVSARIGGYQLVEILVDVGDIVTKGQVLAKFDRSLLLAEHTELAANAALAQINLQRVEALSTENAVSKQDLLQAKTQAKVARALLAKNQLQLDFTNVLAPDDGVVSSRSATLGAATPIGQELFTIIRQQQLEWRGEVTAEQFHRINVGQYVSLTLPGEKQISAVVRQKSPLFNSNTRLAVIFADIHDNSEAVAGMYVSGKIDTGASIASVVPAKSVVIRDGRNYVLSVAQSTGIAKVSLQAVQTGRRQGNDIEIISGLQDVERVVVDGAGFLSDGDIVRVVDSFNSGEVN